MCNETGRCFFLHDALYEGGSWNESCVVTCWCTIREARVYRSKILHRMTLLFLEKYHSIVVLSPVWRWDVAV